MDQPNITATELEKDVDSICPFDKVTLSFTEEQHPIKPFSIEFTDEQNIPPDILELTFEDQPHTKTIQKNFRERLEEILSSTTLSFFANFLLLAILAQPTPQTSYPTTAETRYETNPKTERVERPILPKTIFQHTFSDTQLQSQFNQKLKDKPLTEENYKKVLLDIYSQNQDTFYTKLDVGLFFITIENLQPQKNSPKNIDPAYKVLQSYLQKYNEQKPDLKEFLESKHGVYTLHANDINGLLIQEDITDPLKANCEARFKLEASLMKQILPHIETFALLSGPNKTSPDGHIQLAVKINNKFTSVTRDGVSANKPAIYKTQDIILKNLGLEVEPINKHNLEEFIAHPDSISENPHKIKSLLKDMKLSGQVQEGNELTNKINVHIDKVELEKYLSLVHPSKHNSPFHWKFNTMSYTPGSLKQYLFKLHHVYTYNGANREVLGLGGTQEATQEQIEIIKNFKKEYENNKELEEEHETTEKIINRIEKDFNKSPGDSLYYLPMLTHYASKNKEKYNKIIKIIKETDANYNNNLIEIATLLGKKSTNPTLEIKQLKRLLNKENDDLIKSLLPHLTTHASNPILITYLVKNHFFSSNIFSNKNLSTFDIDIMYSNFKKYTRSTNINDPYEDKGTFISGILRHPNTSFKTVAEISAIKTKDLFKRGVPILNSTGTAIIKTSYE